MPGLIEPDIVKRVRAETNIVDVVGGYVALKKGPKSASYKGLSPFQREKTPSLYVHPEKQIFKCFSSGHGGDVFKFIMLMENLSFPEAVRRLAARASIVIPETTRPRDPKENGLSLLSAVARFWHKTLTGEGAGAKARDFIKAEGIERQAQSFLLGYAPEEAATVEFLRNVGHSTGLAAQMGVVGPQSFAGRLIIPIHDHLGQVVGFTGQLLAPVEGQPRFRVSTDGLCFSRERTLFGLYHNQHALANAGVAILCPSPLDLIWCAQSGIFNVMVAPRATPLSPLQVRAMRRLVGRVLILAEKPSPVLLQSVEALGAEGVQAEIVSIPQSPASLIKADAEAFKKLVSK
jgi:DNA primase